MDPTSSPRDKRRNDNQLREIKKIWTKFFHESTFGGLHFVAGFGYNSRICNIVWIFLFLLSTSLMIYSVIDICARYLQYDVNTLEYYDVDEELDFPAITFCNQNEFKKSVVGGSMTAMIAMAAMFGKKDVKMADLIKQNNRTCFKSEEGDVAKEFDRLGISFFLIKGLIEGMRVSATDSYSSLLKCWWNDEEIECNGQFFNHYTDYGWCFTFNPNMSSVALATNNSNEHRNAIQGYGVNLTEKQIPRVLTNAGPKSGLKVLMNVNQSDYCGAVRKYRGAGFMMQPHDRNTLATFQFTPYISLSPGYDYTLVIEPTMWRRKTENLGRCSSSVNSQMFPGTKIHLQMDCFFDCYYVYMINMCHCLPIPLTGLNYTIGNKTFDLCWGAGLACTAQVFDLFIENGLKDLCSYCKDPCIKLNYQTILSQKRFPSYQQANSLASDINLTRNEVGKNILMVQVYFKDVVLKIVEETQAIDEINLIYSIGGKTTLFMGMSVISFGTVFLQLLLSVDVLLKCIFNATINFIVKIFGLQKQPQYYRNRVNVANETNINRRRIKPVQRNFNNKAPTLFIRQL